MLMWRFQTAHFVITAETVPDYDADLSWMTLAELRKVETGEYEVFGTIVRVKTRTGVQLGEASLWGSVYADPKEFFTAHRDPDPMNRNCTIMRAAKGEEVVIGHYFPDLVREAISNARDMLDDLKDVRVRENAA